MQVFELSGLGRHDEPDNKSYKYQRVLSISSPGTFSRVRTSSTNHTLERRVPSSELLRRRMAPEQGTLNEIIDLNKGSPSKGSIPYHWVGRSGGNARPPAASPLPAAGPPPFRLCYVSSLHARFENRLHFEKAKIGDMLFAPTSTLPRKPSGLHGGR